MSDRKQLPLVLKYVVAIPGGFLSAFVTVIAFGFPEKGPDLLAAEKVAAMVGIMAGGFCFPSSTRWQHAAALLGGGVGCYCFIHPIEEMSLRWDYLPQFRVMVSGGLLGVAFHLLLDSVCWTIGKLFFLERLRNSSRGVLFFWTAL